MTIGQEDSTHHSPARFQSLTSLFDATWMISPANDPVFSRSFSAALGSGFGGNNRTMAKSPGVSFRLLGSEKGWGGGVRPW